MQSQWHKAQSPPLRLLNKEDAVFVSAATMRTFLTWTWWGIACGDCEGIEPWPFSIVIAPTSLMTPKDYTTAKAHNTTRTPDFENQHWRVHNKACIGWSLVPQKAVQSKHCKWLFFDFRSKSTLPTAHFHSVQNGWNSSVTAAGTHSFLPLWHPSPVGVAISAKCGDASKY